MAGEGNGNPLQYSCLENPMDGGAWWAAVHGVAKSQTRLSDFTFTFHFHALEKEMATHSSVLAWRIPGTEEPDGLPFMGSHRIGHDWVTSFHFTFTRIWLEEEIQYSCQGIPWSGEPGRLQSMGSQKVGHTEQLSSKICRWHGKLLSYWKVCSVLIRFVYYYYCVPIWEKNGISINLNLGIWHFFLLKCFKTITLLYVYYFTIKYFWYICR